MRNKTLKKHVYDFYHCFKKLMNLSKNTRFVFSFALLCAISLFKKASQPMNMKYDNPA